MAILHILIVLGAIVLGARMGSIAIGFAGGLGVLILGLTGVTVTADDIPFDVIGIIFSVIAAIAAMQRAGGMDLLVLWAERFLRRNPARITFYAPIITYLMTLFAGTGHTAFSTLPVIVEVAKDGGVRPSKPLSVAVVSSQMAIVASPISAAVVFMSSLLEEQGVSYLALLAVMIPGTFLAIFPVAWLVNKFGGKALTPRAPSAYGTAQASADRAAHISIGVFLGAIVLVVLYATAISEQVGLIADPTLPRNEAIMVVMLSAATVIVLATKISAADVITTPVFRSGMSACVCVLGVAWLGTTLINHYAEQVTGTAGAVLRDYPWLLAVVLFFAAALLYSQAVTAKTLMPVAAAAGVSSLTLVSAFPAVSALFVLPTYPTLLAAVEMDDTGSTKIGRFVFDHPFLLPGTLYTAISVALSYALGMVLI